MHRAPLGAVRPRLARSLWRTLAVASVAGAVALGTTSTVGVAATVEGGSVQAANMQLTLQLSCSVTCSTPITATSSGEFAGVDGATPFSVAWTEPPTGAPNLSGLIPYSSSCNTVWTGATVLGADISVSGAQLTYGTTTYSATVTVWFGGTIVEGAFVPITSEVDITGGPASLVIPESNVPGFLATVPSGTPPPCAGETQTFTASGVFLTLG